MENQETVKIGKVKMGDWNVSISTTAFKYAGRDCARTMFMYLKNTEEHQNAIKEYNKYKAQVLNPKSEFEFECAKAFIMAGDEFNKQIDDANNLK
jgi:hypothetical protein